MSDNMFLKNFMKMRTATAPPAGKKEVPANLIDMEEITGPTYMTIIEEKPAKSVVLEYLRKRITELEDED
jgi:hypothetical protein